MKPNGRRSRLRSAPLGSLFLVALAGAAPSQEPSGTFVTCKEYGTVVGTFLTDLRGRDLARLNFLFGEDVNPRFSPIDDKILFTSPRGGTPGLWTMNRKGEEAARICDGDQGDWFPDGRRIALRRGGRILERSIESGQETVLTPAAWTSCSSPACAPDGRKVLFVLREAGKDAICLAAPGEPEPRRLAEGELLSSPRWSPGGEWIAYQDGAHLGLMDAAGGSRRQLTTWGGHQRRPAWSPDGTRIAFSQGPGPKGPWQMAVTRLDGTKASLIPAGNARSVLCSDWGDPKPGRKAEPKGAAVRPPSRIRLWQTDRPAAPEDWAAFCRERAGWTAVAAEEAPSRESHGGWIVENDAAVFILLAGRPGAALVPKAAAAIELAVLAPQAQEAGPVESVRIRRCGPDEVTLESSSRSGGATAKATWTLGGSRALVQVAPVENADKLRVKAALACAVVPDRFGNDIVADPESPGEGRVFLPRAPMVTGFFGGGSAMLVLVSPDPGSRTELQKGPGPAFLGADATLEKRGVSAGVVAADPAWHLERFAPEGQADPVRFKWRMPVPAAWRLTAQGDARRYSAFFTDKESPFFDKKDAIFHRGKDFASAVRLGVIYLYGRTAGTPPEALTPADLVQDALGPTAARGALDEEGLTGYRRAAGPTTWADVSATLESLAFLFERRLEVQDGAYAGHLSDDLPLFVEGLDRRLKEYAEFAREVQALAGTPEGTRLQGLTAPLATLSEFGGKLGGLPGPKDVASLSAAIKQLTAQESGENRKRFEECRKGILAVAGPREEMLRAYRAGAAALRDAAGSAFLAPPETLGVAEKMRALCQGVLRNRFYTEADWRGEAYDVPAFWLGPRPYE
jgi:dipeptidyl aminopeptidase/acylaminoacyl peptidase